MTGAEGYCRNDDDEICCIDCYKERFGKNESHHRRHHGRMLEESVEPKYELTDETKKRKGHTLYRIRALKDFGDVKKGDLGGWIESEDNLSHEGNCWVGDHALVYDDAEVYGNANVFGYAKVYGDAKVHGDAKVYDRAEVFGEAEVYGTAKVFDEAEVFDYAEVYENAKVCEDGWVYGNACVYGKETVIDYRAFEGDLSWPPEY